MDGELPPPLPLPPEMGTRLMEIARSCKAAARAVVLYPPAHPAIATTLARIVDLTSAAQLPAPLRIGVLPDALLVDGRRSARPDAAIAELASLLHEHLIGVMVIHPGGDAEAWRQFLNVLTRPPDAVRAEGGISRVWTTMAGRHVEIEELDYVELLKERRQGIAVNWEQVIDTCLFGRVSDLTDETVRELLDIASKSDTLSEFLTTFDSRAAAAGQGIDARAAALTQLFERLVQSVSVHEPDRRGAILSSIGEALTRLTPELLVSILKGQPSESPSSAIDAIVQGMSDATVADFVARNALDPGSALDRVALAFQTLVPDAAGRERLLALAHDQAAASPLAQANTFEQVWDDVAQKLMTSYSDEPFVSAAYARELSVARTQALSVEQSSDDPPERLAEWLGTVNTSELRKLDLSLVIDLLRLENNLAIWTMLMRPVRDLIEDLLLLGDFDAALDLIREIAREANAQSVS